MVPTLLQYFEFRGGTFQAGNLANCRNEWENLTGDPEVLETVTGLKITFLETPHVKVVSNQFRKKEE